MTTNEELVHAAMQQTQEDKPLFLAQGSRLVAGHSGVFAEYNKRIAELQSEVAAFEAISFVQMKQIDELQARNNDLREALIVCKQYITEAIIDDKYHEASCGLDELYLLRDKAINLYNAAISAPTDTE